MSFDQGMKVLHFMLWCLVWTSFPVQAISDIGSGSLIEITTADKSVADDSVLPDFSKAQPVELPDLWQHDPDGFYGSVWYRLQFPLSDKPSSQWALLLRDVNMNAEVWVNGVYLGSGGSMQRPVSRYWHSPLMFVVSPSDLRENNEIVIRVVAYANKFGELGEVVTGDASAVTGEYQYEYFRRVNLHVISAALAAVYALFMGVVWYRRRDAVFFWGALACAAWAVSSLNFFVVDPLLDELEWEKLMLLSMGWIPLLFYFFLLRLDGVSPRRLHDSLILAGAGLLNVSLLAADMHYLFTMSRVWHLYSLVFGLVGLIRVFYSWYTRRKNPQLIMIIVFLLIAICGVHDFLSQTGVIDDSVYWLDYSVPMILLFVGYLMVSRFLWAVNRSEQLNRSLETRVEQAQQKIEADYQTILALETEQASLRERERIYSDMHDDMGAKLLSMVYNAESSEMRDLARSAMDDLRAIVSKKPGEKHRLEAILLQLERDSQKRCKEAGFAFDWQQQPIEQSVSLSAEADQHLRRLLAESVTNALKHSAGSLISIRVASRSGCLRMVVADNGDYTQMTHWLEGRGIQSMKHRVKQLSGKIKWHATPDGGCVSWTLPLAPNQA